MSDQMQRGMPGPVEKNLSGMTPSGAVLMGPKGGPNTTVAQYLGQLGIDVNGPVQQLIDFAQKQQQNANPLQRVRNIAADAALQRGGTPAPGASPAAPPTEQPSPSGSPGGLQGLMGRLGG